MNIFLTLLLVVVSLLMTLIVLVQRGRGGGLSGAFGMGGGAQTAFGTKTGDVFTTVTVVLFAVFMLIAIVLNLRVKNATSTTPIPGALTPAPVTAPATPVAPATSAATEAATQSK